MEAFPMLINVKVDNTVFTFENIIEYNITLVAQEMDKVAMYGRFPKLTFKVAEEFVTYKKVVETLDTLPNKVRNKHPDTALFLKGCLFFYRRWFSEKEAFLQDKVIQPLLDEYQDKLKDTGNHRATLEECSVLQSKIRRYTKQLIKHRDKHKSAWVLADWIEEELNKDIGE